jgi:DNA-binding MarR family transcriptional regulator
MARRHVLVRTVLYLHHQLERASVDQDLSPSQYLLLHFLTEEPRLASDFAAVMRFKQPSVGDLVRKLEERGWIERDVDEGDRRARFVRITDAGRKAFAEYEAYLENHLGVFLGHEEIARANQDLVPLYEHWNVKRIARFDDWARNHSARGKRKKRRDLVKD